MHSSTQVLALLFSLTSGSAAATLNTRQNGGMSATFTSYSGCGASVSCGPGSATGSNQYSAAVNQQAYGGMASGVGPGCGVCWRINASHDSGNNPLGGSIVVKVNNECPAAGNDQYCGQTASQPLNQYGGAVHLDLCTDSGASQAIFGGRPGIGFGTAQIVSCAEWDAQTARLNGGGTAAA
ncbi:MAG: hypothetical protein M1817_006312 [Caeruleum heppii]|nr:MAG: hypothetical protein M1817_006312 [Caeruleum heppii]